MHAMQTPILLQHVWADTSRPLAQRNFVLTSSVLAWLLKFVELSRVCNITGVKQPLREASSHCHKRDSCFAAFLATSQKTESAKLVELNWL